ncbi:MAG: pantoate--beta-alanine ligase [Spirochaetaceae bacterium]
MAKIIETIDEWKEIYNSQIKGKKSLGLVPTMGALHIGHKSLIKRSVKENDITICSIFVNPTQFNSSTDLRNYPTTIEKDKQILESDGCDYIFIPNKQMMYPDGYRYKMTENKFSTKLCGAHRPGHFDGVLTVVLKLLNVVSPDNAYFGEKDWQQYRLIKGMIDSMFLPYNIIPCQLIREADGLAFSSRNSLLTPENRLKAPKLYKIISSGIDTDQMKNRLTELGFVVDYIEIEDNRVLAAATLGDVRLIDNVKR